MLPHSDCLPLLLLLPWRRVAEYPTHELCMAAIRKLDGRTINGMLIAAYEQVCRAESCSAPPQLLHCAALLGSRHRARSPGRRGCASDIASLLRSRQDGGDGGRGYSRPADGYGSRGGYDDGYGGGGGGYNRGGAGSYAADRGYSSAPRGGYGYGGAAYADRGYDAGSYGGGGGYAAGGYGNGGYAAGGYDAGGYGAGRRAGSYGSGAGYGGAYGAGGDRGGYGNMRRAPY